MQGLDRIIKAIVNMNAIKAALCAIVMSPSLIRLPIKIPITITRLANMTYDV